MHPQPQCPVPDAELVAEPIQDGDMEMQVDGGDAADAGPQVVPVIKAEDEGAPFDMFAAQAREPEVGRNVEGWTRYSAKVYLPCCGWR